MSKFLNYKNIKVHYSDVGKGRPVVLLHGFLEDISMWNNLLPKLKEVNRFIGIDLLGHGKTGCIDGVFTMEEMAKMIKFVLDKLEINLATFIGHSLGGYVTLALAEQYPSIVNSLCLVNSTARDDSEERKENRVRAINMAKRNYEALVSMSVSNLFVEETRLKFLDRIRETKIVAMQTSKEAYIATTEGMRIRKNRTHILKSAPYKKLIITGKRDPVLAYSSIVEEAEHTNSKLLTFSNGHMSHIENEKELIQALKEFLETN